MRVRGATSRDRNCVRAVHRSAFSEGEREMVAKLAIELLSEDVTPRVVSLVAEIEGRVVGHVAFSPVAVDGEARFQGYILAPLGVRPDYQGRGIGSQLVENGLRRMLGVGVDVDVLFVYGDPTYYRRFGFSVGVAERYVPPYELQYPAGWQGLVLKECRAGKSPVRISCVTALCDPALW